MWCHNCVALPRFPKGHENFGNSHIFKADIGLLTFAWIFRTSWPKMGVLGAKYRKGWCDVDSQRTCFTIRVFTHVPILVKINQEMQPWECAQMETRIHTNFKLQHVWNAEKRQSWHTGNITDWMIRPLQWMFKVSATSVDASLQTLAKAGDRLKNAPPPMKT